MLPHSLKAQSTTININSINLTQQGLSAQLVLCHKLIDGGMPDDQHKYRFNLWAKKVRNILVQSLSSFYLPGADPDDVVHFSEACSGEQQMYRVKDLPGFIKFQLEEGVPGVAGLDDESDEEQEAGGEEEDDDDESISIKSEESERSGASSEYKCKVHRVQ